MRNFFKEDLSDLATGPILKKLILFFLPIAAGTIFQQLYNAVDAFVVNYFIGDVALAAVGGTPAVTSNLIIGFCVALTTGCSVRISQFYGAKKYNHMKNGIKTAFIFCFFLGIISTILTLIFSKDILIALKTTSDAFDYSLQYQNIYFAGSICLIMYNMGAGILRASGDSKFPFLCLFIGCGLNIALDLLFVAVLNLEVAGVAIATVISQFVSMILVMSKLIFTNNVYKFTLKGAKFELKILKRMLRIGIPSGLQNFMYGFSNVIIQVAVNSLGTVVVSSWAMCGKVDGIYWAISSALASAITAFIGQNYGAKENGRIKKCARQSFWFFLSMTIVVSAFILLFAKPVLHLLKSSQAVVDTTYVMLWLFVPFYFLWSLVENFSSVLRGVGDTIIPSIIELIGVCIFRIIWIYTVFAHYFDITSLCLCYPISWGSSGTAIFIYYLSVKNKKLAVYDNSLS